MKEKSEKLKCCQKEGRLEVGCDEAGRGCLAGPVYAGAVIWPEDLHHDMLNDSKKFTHHQRMKLRKDITEHALDYAIGACSVDEIDDINILNASFKAMRKAVQQLQLTPSHLLIDGPHFNKIKGLSHSCIVKGDGKYYSIAAASILAKTERDLYMMKLHDEYPVYSWNSNKGYATKAHRDGIEKHGFTVHHRKSFHIKSIEQPSLFKEQSS